MVALALLPMDLVRISLLYSACLRLLRIMALTIITTSFGRMLALLRLRQVTRCQISTLMSFALARCRAGVGRVWVTLALRDRGCATASAQASQDMSLVTTTD